MVKIISEMSRNKMKAKRHKIKLVSFFFFDGAKLSFSEWLPQSKEQSIKFTKDDINYYIFVDENTPDTFKFKSNGGTVEFGNVRGLLKVIVEFNVDAQTKDAIDRHDPPVELISRIAPVYCILEDSIRDIIRNDLGQYWIPHPYHHPEESERDILGGLHFYNTTTKKMEQFLYGATIRLECQIPDKQILIDEQKWEKIETLINENYRSDLALVCLSNAFSLFQEKNYRLALIEAIISLERALFKHLPELIPETRRQSAQPYLNGDSVTEAVNNLLPLVSESLGIDQPSITMCSEAVNYRNQIIHQTRFRIDPNLVRQYLHCIRIVVRKIVPHQF
jgi:hypothetical protein